MGDRLGQGLLQRAKCRTGGGEAVGSGPQVLFVITQDAVCNGFFGVGEEEEETITVAAKLQT